MEEPYSKFLSGLERFSEYFPWEMKEISGIYRPRVKLINMPYIDRGGSEC